jgi:electron transfer flavoprotein alpha subunit
MKKQVLVYIDEDAVQDSIDLIEAAWQMFGSEELAAFALAPGGQYANAENIFDHIVTSEPSPVANYETAKIARIIEALHHQYRFDAILIPSTTFGRIIAPRAAIRLRAGLVADVTEIKKEGEEILLVRPAFSGRLLATVVCRGPGPIMMSVRPRTFVRSNNQRYNEHKQARVIGWNTENLPDTGIRLMSRTERKQDVDIRESAVLVAGGGGAMKDFPMLEELASLLGGKVAASRKAVDHGKASREIQVGQSGKMVSPEVYIALGISGSSQHMAGLKRAKHIISVNIDPHAPICSMSDIAVHGDYKVFIEALMKRIKDQRTQTKGGL